MWGPGGKSNGGKGGRGARRNRGRGGGHGFGRMEDGGGANSIDIEGLRAVHGAADFDKR